ncbi:hypothetical protein HDU76_006759 [Blyttiomyces sp. JEL0837]|nr:hypothetical protein HDU76_006759 [Blyttiomyces sp. JEL0837]
MKQNLIDLSTSHSDIVSYTSIGTTREKRDIPAVTLSKHSSSGQRGVDGRPSMIITGLTQPREVLTAHQVLYLIRYIVNNVHDPLVDNILSSSRLVLVPMMNPDGYEAITASDVSSDVREIVVKNRAKVCSNGNLTTDGVHLGHNWGYMWDYNVTAGSEYADQCHGMYRGSEPFSEPETIAMRDLFQKEQPKASIFFHSRSKSSQSRIFVPYMYHKSFLKSHREDTKNKLMHKNDLNIYDSLTSTMNDAASNSSIASNKDKYHIGTAWELMERTVSGSELDWAFDQAGVFSVILQIGTAEERYWPSHDMVAGLLDKHVSPTLALAALAPSLPAKTTIKGKSSIVRHVQTLPIYLGVTLAVLLLIGFFVARAFGYDNIVGRFKTAVKHLQHRLGMRARYMGLGNKWGTGDGAGSGRTGRSGNGNAGGGLADGGGQVDNDEIGFDDLELEDDGVVEEDEDDNGVGFTYRAL